MKKLIKFKSQLDKKIMNLENKLDEAREQLTNSIDDVHNILMFGLAKDAENITKIMAQLEVLYEQREILETMFEDVIFNQE